MTITPIKTNLIQPGDNIKKILSNSISVLQERSIIAIASKAFSFSESCLVPKKSDDPEEKYKLVKEQAELYTNPHSSKYQLMLTKKSNTLFMFAGVDESNSAGHFTTWPPNPQDSVNDVWDFLRSHYQLDKVGVIMTDSTSVPFNWGVIGQSIAYCGFYPLKDYRNTEDVHGRLMKMEQLSLVNCLASAAVIEMGEGNEQQPLAIITNIFQAIKWQAHHPTTKELTDLHIDIQDDAFAPILKQANWEKGGQHE